MGSEIKATAANTSRASKLSSSARIPDPFETSPEDVISLCCEAFAAIAHYNTYIEMTQSPPLQGLRVLEFAGLAPGIASDRRRAWLLLT